MATRASRIALAGSNISSTGEVDADLLDNTDSAAFLSLDSNGNLGIGIVPETDWHSNFDAIQLGSATLYGYHANAQEVACLGSNFRHAAASFVTSTRVATGYAQQYLQDHSGNHVFRTAASGNADAAITWVDAMQITNSGNVGIGTTTPSFESGTGTGLEIRNASGNGAHVKLTDNASGAGGSNGFDLYAFNGSGYVENYEAQSLVFRNNGAERMRILPSGNVGIGTAAPSEQLHIFNNSQSWDAYARIRLGTESSGYEGSLGYHRGTTNDADRGLYLSGSGTTKHVNVRYNGSVGIGNNIPAYKLDVGGTTEIQGRFKSSGGTGWTQGAIVIESSDSTSNPGNRGQGVYMYNVPNQRTWYSGTLYNNGNKFGIGYQQAAGLQHIAADNVKAKLVIDGDNGNVGIGTTGPGAKLSVSGPAALANLGGGSTGSSALYVNSTSGHVGELIQVLRNGASKMHMGNNGDLGLGTAAPYSKLHIGAGTGGGNQPANTSIIFGSSDNRNIQFLGQTANGNEGTIGAWNGVYNFQSSKIVFNKPAANLGEMLFYTNAGAGPVLRVAMTNHGRVVFSPTGVADGKGVTTYATGSNGHYISCTGTPNYWITNHGVASATGVLSTFYNNGTYCGGINISSTNVTSYVSASDYRLKENVVPMTGATERLKQLNPVTFDWKNSGESSEGFIAHEVGAVVPISTTGTKDEVYDEEGAADNPKINEGDPKYQSVDPAKLVPLLVKTIQELEARLSKLENA